jgi:hypothetical protein
MKHRNRHYLSVGVLIVFCLLALGSTDSDDGASSIPDHDEVSAYTICQQFVEDGLKAPRTAKFPWGASDRTVHLGGGKYRVRAYVDAQNSFGAMIRSNFDCTVQWTGGDRWNLEALSID